MVLQQAGPFVVSLAVGLPGRRRSLAHFAELGDMIIDNAGGFRKGATQNKPAISRRLVG
jgi:hypothetical protein